MNTEEINEFFKKDKLHISLKELKDINIWTIDKISQLSGIDFDEADLVKEFIQADKNLDSLKTVKGVLMTKVPPLPEDTRDIMYQDTLLKSKMKLVNKDILRMLLSESLLERNPFNRILFCVPDTRQLLNQLSAMKLSA